MKKAFDQNIELPPIETKAISKTGYYDIIDGRHRFAMSIVKGFSYIPAFVEH